MISGKIVPKGWGREFWITNTENYCGKILYFDAGKKFSWHYHLKKDEVFFVSKGRLELRFGNEDSIESCEHIILETGDSFHVPTGMRHQLIALTISEVFEISTQHFESDTYRIIKGD
jgi:mannose-6-phosphate isomerase-like protein (cupin superfamily)